MALSSVYVQHLKQPAKICLQSLTKEWSTLLLQPQHYVTSVQLVTCLHTSSCTTMADVRGKGKLFRQSFNKPEWFRKKNPNKKIIAKKVEEVVPKLSELETNRTFAEEPDVYLSKEEWEKRYTKHPRFFIGVMGRLAHLGHLQKAKSLLHYMDKTCGPTEAVLHNFLVLCVKYDHIDEMFETYQKIVKMHNNIPAATLSILIEGFCKTESWRESVKFFDQLKTYDLIKSKDYCKLLCGALRHGDLQFGRELFNEMINKRARFQDDAMKAILQTFHCDTDDKHFRQTSKEIVKKLLFYMREEIIYPSKEVADEFISWFERNQDQDWTAGYTKVTESGKCRQCHTQLENLTISDYEFQQIHNEIMEKVIKSKDVFLNTSPEELNVYRKFIDESEPFDIVIDGLNAAHIDPYTNKSEQLRQIVVYFAEELRQRVLVIGRRHMLHGSKKDWSPYNMKWIRDIADCFFADNVSKDDPFLLYATLHSGNRAMYVSRDMMRDHRALLTPQTLQSFLKWQRSHQYVPVQIRRNRAPVIQRPLVYDTITQTNKRSWHIPVHDGLLHEQWKLPHLWLCVTQSNDTHTVL